MKKCKILFICVSIVLITSLSCKINPLSLEKSIYKVKSHNSILNHNIYSSSYQNPNNTFGYYVYFVHGYYGSNAEFSDLVDFLIEESNLLERYTSIRYFDYFAKGIKEGLSKHQIHLTFTISDLASNFYKQLIEAHPTSTQLDIVAHSLGGLITRELIRLYRNDLEEAGIIINRIITLGTPHTGINLNFLSSMMLLFFGNQWVTPILNSINSGSSFLKILNSNPNSYSKGIKWINIAGTFFHPITVLTTLLLGNANDGLINIESALAESISLDGYPNHFKVPLFSSVNLVINNVHHSQLINDPNHQATYPFINKWLNGGFSVKE